VDLARALIREPDVASARAYARRVGQLAAVYVSLFCLSLAGILLVAWNGRLFVTLAQRSNVETLVVAFILLLFAYLALVSSTGAWGGARILAWRAARRLGLGADDIERRKLAALGRPRRGPAVALNRVLERRGRPGEPFDLVLADAAGEAGRLRVDGVRVTHLEAPGNGSNDLLAYFVRQLATVLEIDPDQLDVVCWRAIDEEDFHRYVGMVDAFRALGRRVGGGTHLWPRLTISAEQCAAIEARLSEVCGAIRDEGFLPQREFEGEHKIPIIPEPLGIVSLARREKRVDPLSSMGSSLVIVAAIVALVVLFVLRPPWVPGT
jgi:hypothetical protein